MRISSTIRPVINRPITSLPAATTVEVDSYVASNSKSELWRDYGVNPKAMFTRAFLKPPLNDGTPLENGKPANHLVTQSLKESFHNLLDSNPQQKQLQSGIVQIAERFGVAVNLEEGVPLVNWDEQDPSTLDVRHSGGTAANHELVHALQCVIGGASAFGTVAAENFQSDTGREPRSMEELAPYIQGLSTNEKTEAKSSIVKPMEEQAYHTFEEAAFHATGMMGKKSKNQDFYLERMGQVVNSFADAYREAVVPVLDTTMGPEIYGKIGHIARTNGETALVLGGAGFAYCQLAKQAMKLHPLMAIPVASPLAYMLYRATVSG